ncbi:FAD-dependent oxidoreductase [Kitasatospora sp. RB6PN24]|uniref:protoporphyrinogen/coproporphyrinogen oxidase n=1 Tax=Kitasatospora humi TaxID=2893891 RepID=UPI001E50C20B|nr:FAD-dependent oxidoreductase [Kitasatospora humi]MCC9311284.1 FAD-dependent oxidoreductase [Kitasatospora humi]
MSLPMTATHDRIVVLGAGPCGLACANALRQLEHRNWVVLEAGSSVGGLASSVVDEAGFTWDLGGHVVFSHFREFDRLLAELFGSDELLIHDRSSYVRFGNRWVPYPFQQHLGTLPPQDAVACLAGLASVRLRGSAGQVADDFGAWLHAAYGTPMVERFFGPYNTKVWSVPPREMSATWVAERVAPASLGGVLAAALRPRRPHSTWGPNATFGFPACGGTGEVWRRLAARLGNQVRTRARAVAIDVRERRVVLAGGEVVDYDHLVSTMPLDQLVACAASAPDQVRRAAARLRHNTVAMVGLGYRTPTTDPRSWLYFPQADVPFYRVTNFSKYAPANVHGGDISAYSSWMTETSFPADQSFDPQALTRSCDEALRRHGLVPEQAPLASAHVEVIPYAYPVPTLRRDQALAEITPWLEAHGIHSRGRFGTWRYEIGNMDHAVKMGIDVAHRLITGTAEELVPAQHAGAVVVGSRS